MRERFYSLLCLPLAIACREAALDYLRLTTHSLLTAYFGSPLIVGGFTCESSCMPWLTRPVRCSHLSCGSKTSKARQSKACLRGWNGELRGSWLVIVE